MRRTTDNWICLGVVGGLIVLYTLGCCCWRVYRALSQAPPRVSVPTAPVATAPVPWPPAPFRDQVISEYELDTFTPYAPSAPPLPMETSAPCSEIMPLPARNIGLEMEAERTVEVSDCKDGDRCQDPELHVKITIRF